MTIYFISDLHLSADATSLTDIFLRFISNQAKQAQRLYILGDLFEAWIGDDNDEPFAQEIIQALVRLSKTTALFIMPGNRDFLIGQAFAKACGASLLHDPTVIDLYGTPTLLTHGDLLCTDDKAYQRWRGFVHCRWLQRIFTCLPLAWRRKIAVILRNRSRTYTQSLPPSRMDVTTEGIKKMLDDYGVTQVIHGHTHRPAIHHFTENSHSIWHYVLSDWHEKGNVLICKPGLSPRLVSLT